MVQGVISSALIVAGAVIMLVSIVRTKDLLAAAPLIRSERRGAIVQLLRLHRLLMMFFLAGYVVVAVSFLLERYMVGRAFVGVVFLFGAAFVLLGIVIQSRMLAEVRSTFHGIVPVCSRCHKVRDASADPGRRDSWRDMETFMTEHVEMAEGFCPDCMDRLYGLPEQS